MDLDNVHIGALEMTNNATNDKQSRREYTHPQEITAESIKCSCNINQVILPVITVSQKTPIEILIH
jgi:hypothetical protein